MFFILLVVVQIQGLRFLDVFVYFLKSIDTYCNVVLVYIAFKSHCKT